MAWKGNSAFSQYCICKKPIEVYSYDMIHIEQATVTVTQQLVNPRESYHPATTRKKCTSPRRYTIYMFCKKKKKQGINKWKLCVATTYLCHNGCNFSLHNTTDFLPKCLLFISKQIIKLVVIRYCKSNFMNLQPICSLLHNYMLYISPSLQEL